MRNKQQVDKWEKEIDRQIKSLFEMRLQLYQQITYLALKLRYSKSLWDIHSDINRLRVKYDLLEKSEGIRIEKKL
jgi:hypothetical protein